MNVLKTDFISKRKRLEKRRQEVIRTFFSGYHTVSNIFPSESFKFPVNTESKLRAGVEAKPDFFQGFSRAKDSVKLTSLTDRSNDGSSSKTEIMEQWHQLHNQKCSTKSSSSEFQKLLEPFQSFREHDFKDSSEQLIERNFGDELKRNSKILSNKKNPEIVSLDSFFQNRKTCYFEQYKKKEQTSREIPNKSSTFKREILEEYNIFNLPAPRNQKSIEEVLNGKDFTKPGVSQEIVRSPRIKKMKWSEAKKNGSFEMKTPKNKARKSPRLPGSSKTGTTDSGAFILAVTEGRGHARGEVGIAAMDPRRPHLVLCQISDNQRYVHSLAKMNVFDLVEVIVPNTFVDCSRPNKLYFDLRSTFPKVTLTSVQRRHFNESAGIELIKQYCSRESTSVMILLQDKFYALSASAALIKYIEFTQNVRLVPQSLKIEYQGMQDTMIIDLNTANLLELVLCASHPETNLGHSLLGVVKYCHTKGGLRLLRANILQPPCSLSKIETRLDCVTELVNDPLFLCSLEAAVSSFSALEDLLNLCTHAPQQDGLKVAEYQLKYTLLLKSTLELLPTLRASLADAKSRFFCEVRESLEDVRFSSILERILRTVLENAKTVKGSVAIHLHGCFAIKAGINSLLDVAKKTYCEIVQEISDLVSDLREKHGMPLRLAFSTNKGFHVQYTLPPAQRNLKESSFPKEFILIQKSKTTFSFYTAELVALDQRSQHVLNEIKLMTNAILFQLLTDIRQDIGCLFNLCEYIAELDVVVSFAHVGSGTNYVRPKFGEKLDVRNSRHPILDVIHDGEVVPNDIYAENGKNFTILTGPNQSGKSIYIRQIALLQIMAQIGCYVPAVEANFRLTDRIFSRIGFDDNIENNASTLIVEMRDMEYLNQNISPRSLVIIDELCRGTSVDEGTSLAFAICEELLDTSAFVFFTTHFLFLTKLEELYLNVTNYHFETKIEITSTGKPSVRFTHSRKPGATKADLYGLQVAEMTSFPKDVCRKAKEISIELSQERKSCRKVSGLLAEYELSVRLRNELMKGEPDLTWPKMESIIQHFKQMYVNLVKKEGRWKIDATPWEELEESRESFFSKKRKNSQCGPISFKRSKKKPMPEEKIKKHTIFRLARSVQKKYRRLNQLKARCVEKRNRP